MKCLREMNDRKVFKNQKSKCLFPRGRDIQHIASWGKRMTQFFV